MYDSLRLEVVKLVARRVPHTGIRTFFTVSVAWHGNLQYFLSLSLS